MIGVLGISVCGRSSAWAWRQTGGLGGEGTATRTDGWTIRAAGHVLLPPQSATGRPNLDHWTVRNGILWRLRARVL